MSGVERWREKDGLLLCEAAYCLNGRGQNPVDSIVVEVCLSAHVVRDKDEFHWPFGRRELHGRVVRLFVSGYKSHVSGWDANEGGHVGVASHCFGGPW